MSKRPNLRDLALLCIHCSGGAADTNGAYTVCALCVLAEDLTNLAEAA
ncbi:hypothetical protein [Pseudarthrobacter sp. AB1]|nr:hypothetical protein [Pseudarthrobacter sp. AB1]